MSADELRDAGLGAYAELSDEELLRLLTEEGDRSAEEALCIRYKPLVRSCSRAYYLLGADRDDVLQEGMLGLFRAIKTYRSDRNVPFCAFAGTCITGSILTAVKSASRKKHQPLNNSVSLQQPASPEDGDERTLQETLETPISHDPEYLVIEREGYAALLSAIDRRLTPLEQQVLSCYLDGMAYRQIAERLGRSSKSVDNALRRIKLKLENLRLPE